MGWEKTLPFRQWHSSCSNYCIFLLYCQRQIVISPLLSQTFLSLSAFRLRKQNMCTVRGELCIVSGPTRLLYKLWTSFGYAWAQMLCCMSQKHVRNGRLQVSNIFVYNFPSANMIVITSKKLSEKFCSLRIPAASSKITQTCVNWSESEEETKAQANDFYFPINHEKMWPGKAGEGIWDFGVNWKVFLSPLFRSLPRFFCVNREKRRITEKLPNGFAD